MAILTIFSWNYANISLTLVKLGSEEATVTGKVRKICSVVSVLGHGTLTHSI